jgi:predicted porin
VYGLIDASVAQVEKNGVKTTYQGNGDYLGSSVLGFKGSEDLGGGMKASFQLEGDLNVGNGSGDGEGSTTNSTNFDGGLTFDRQSWVGISTANMGVRVGRLSDALDGLNGYAQGFNLADVDVSMGSKNANTTEVSAKVMGYTVTATYSNDKEAYATGGNQGAALGTASVQGVIAGYKVAIGHGESGADNQSVIAINGALGAANVGVLYQTGEASAKKNSFVQATVTYPMGNGLTARGSYFDRSHDVAASEYSGYAVMLQKDLSKRTSVYAGYRLQDYNTNASDEKTTVVGLQHSF